MRIMEIVSGGSINGAIVHCLELTRELARRGHEMTLVCRQGAWIMQQPLPAGTEVIESDLHRWPTDELRRISQIIRDRKIELVHTHQSRANFFGVLLKLFGDVRTVATAHNRLIQLHWMWNDHVIAASAATGLFHQRFNFCSQKRVEVIHNFVNWQRLAEVPLGTRNSVRQSLGIHSTQPVMGVIGDVIRRKGAIYLVKAMPAILKHHPDAVVLFVGKQDENYLREVQVEAVRLGVTHAIRWLDRRSDVPQLLTALDVFVLPSREEQLPIAVLEAMASGLPVVATNVGGLPECIQHGTDGYLVSRNNPPALANALLPLLASQELRRKIGLAAAERVHQDFSPEGQSQRVENLFCRIVGKYPRSLPAPSPTAGAA